MPFWPSLCSRLQMSRRIRSLASSDTSVSCCGNWNRSYGALLKQTREQASSETSFSSFACSPCGSWSSRRFPPGTLHRKESRRTAFHTCRRPETTSRTQGRTFLFHPPWPEGSRGKCSLEFPLLPRTGPDKSKVINQHQISAKTAYRTQFCEKNSFMCFCENIFLGFIKQQCTFNLWIIT